MYKKVEINCGAIFVDGTKIGEEKNFYNGTIIIEDQDGTTIFAEYGTLVDGEFYQFCRSSNHCVQCNMHNSPNCRYNRLTNKGAGYYINFPEAD